MTRFRFYINALSSRIEVFPLNWWKCALIDEKERGQVYYRRKFNGTLTFTDNNGGDDFTLFYMVEAISPCERLILEIEEKDSGADTYHAYWDGYFSTTDGTFDLDKCTFDITPNSFDNYMNFDEHGDDEYNILDIATDYNTNTATTAYTHNRMLTEVIEYLVTNIEPAATVTSWFLNNEFNPVTGDYNKYRYLMISQKSDIKRPASSNPATIGMMAFNQLMETLRNMYNLYWTWDGATFRIEHYSYWDNESGLDLRTQDISSKSNKYLYRRDNMFRHEKFSFMEANDANYKPHIITYDSKCTSKDDWEYSNNITTDLSYIEFCVADAGGEGLISNISDEGFVITANFKVGAAYYVYFGQAFENTNSTYNYPNSWSYLLHTLFLHNRVLMNGYINSTYVDFISARKNKQQGIKAIVCYESNYDPSDYITTELGESYFSGQKGFVDSATIHPDGLVEFNLLYGEDEDTGVTPPAPTNILHCIITDDYIYSELSTPNIYDTYYWIWWDDGLPTEDCQEIFIPAGDIYATDVRPALVTTYKFNISDESLDGWEFVLNDNEAADTSVRDIECGGAVPPAIPASPVLSTPTQAAFCDPVFVDWTTSAGATYYKVFRNPDHLLADNWEDISHPTVSQYYDYQAGETNGYTWKYKIQACNISGCSADSNEEELTHPNC